MDYSRYPDNWSEISLRIRERENWRCKWCGLPNGAIGYRDLAGNFHQLLGPDELVSQMADLKAEQARDQGFKVIKIMLTVAHLGVSYPDGRPGDQRDKMDCRDENLAALCQQCHLRYDLQEHRQNAIQTRLKKLVAAGQQTLF